MINYELAKQLKDAGFPQPEKEFDNWESWTIKHTYGQAYITWKEDQEPQVIRVFPGMTCVKENVYIPTLSELIAACGSGLKALLPPNTFDDFVIDKWGAVSKIGIINFYKKPYEFSCNDILIGNTPEEAVANLWLALNKKHMRTIFGTFNGQDMVGEDGFEYAVNQNYVSKSRLLEGDGLKLEIDDDGSFYYKQIAPVSRRHLSGSVVKDGRKFMVKANDRLYHIVQASAWYYKLEIGDTVAISIPYEGSPVWAAVDAKIPNVIN